MPNFNKGWKQTPEKIFKEIIKNRGIKDNYFNLSLTSLPSPFKIKGMSLAVNRIASAIKNNEPIHIFGDFDADGINATSVLYNVLSSQIGTDKVTFSIPNREAENHQIGCEALSEANGRGVKLGISVDIGTSSFEEADLAKKLGFDLIITDHHKPPVGNLPDAYALLNAAQEECFFADNILCGAGMAYFLALGLEEELKKQGSEIKFSTKDLLDKVAIATVADMMPIVGINRILIKNGLDVINAQTNDSVSKLIEACGINLNKKTVTSQTIAFEIAPKINSIGRLSSATKGVEIMTGQGDYEDLIIDAMNCNEKRKSLERETYNEALKIHLEENVNFIYRENWHPGVIGLVAGRIARDIASPVGIGMLSKNSEGKKIVRVSFRGAIGFDIAKLLEQSSEFLLGHGGHEGAGGCSLLESNWNLFKSAMENHIEKTDISESIKIENRKIKKQIIYTTISAINKDLVERIDTLEPTGRGNPRPVLQLSSLKVVKRTNQKNSIKAILSNKKGTDFIEVYIFSPSENIDKLMTPGRIVSVVGEAEYTKRRGIIHPAFKIQDVKESK